MMAKQVYVRMVEIKYLSVCKCKYFGVPISGQCLMDWREFIKKPAAWVHPEGFKLPQAGRKQP
jgi:hypothetical protein